MERKQEQIEKHLTNGDKYPKTVRKKPLLTSEELEQFLDNYLQKLQTDRMKLKK